MKVTFTHDFRGKLTRELFYPAGTVLDVEDDVAAELIALGHAVATDDPAPQATIEPVAVEVEARLIEAPPVVDPTVDVEEAPDDDEPKKGKGRGKST